jgi:aubergine-like protein
VCHDKKSNGMSAAGICCTLDSNFTTYYSRICFNRPGSELTAQLRRCLEDAIRAFFARNNMLPESKLIDCSTDLTLDLSGIIIYRDGVGDGSKELYGICYLDDINV